MNPRKQVKELEKQLKRDPSSVVLRLRLAAALVADGRAPEGFSLYHAVAAGYAAQGRIEQATAVCESALELDPMHPTITQLLVELHAQIARRPPPPPEPPPVPVALAAASAPAARRKRPSGFDIDSMTPGSSELPLAARRRETGSGASTSSPPTGTGQVQTPRRMPLSVRSLSGATPMPSRPAPPDRRKPLSSAPPPLVRSAPRQPSSVNAQVTRPVAELPLSPRRGRGPSTGVEDDAVTRVADRMGPLPLPLPATRGMPIDTMAGQDTRSAMTGATELERLARALDAEDVGEATIVDDGQALSRVMSSSAAATAARPDLPILKGLPPRAITAILAGMQRRQAPAGAMVVREGEPCQSCFVVARGELRVLKRDPLNPRGDLFEVSRLGPGVFFGESALLPNRTRTGTVQAVGDVELLEIPRTLLARVAQDVPEVSPFLARLHRERVLANLVGTVPFFAPLGEAERSELVRQVQLHRVEPRGAVIREGNRAGGFHVVVVGALEVTRAVSGQRTIVLATLGEGTYLGEMSLLRGDVARATVSATVATELAVIPAKNFYALVASHPMLWDEVRREARRRELDGVELVTGTTGSV
jgi:CRP-like cAMP-binding protein